MFFRIRKENSVEKPGKREKTVIILLREMKSKAKSGNTDAEMKVKVDNFRKRDRIRKERSDHDSMSQCCLSVFASANKNQINKI
jgi:hypothetical protein